jgi:hypothetical protein
LQFSGRQDHRRKQDGVFPLFGHWSPRSLGLKCGRGRGKDSTLEISDVETTNRNRNTDCTSYNPFPNLWQYTMDTRPNHCRRWRSGSSPYISHCQPCVHTSRWLAVCCSQALRSWCRLLQALVVYPQVPFAETTTLPSGYSTERTELTRYGCCLG